MTVFRMDLHQLENVKKAMNENVTALYAEAAKLHDQYVTIKDAWKDSTSYNYLNNYNNYIQKIKELRDVIEQYSDVLDLAIKSYTKTKEDNIALCVGVVG